MSNNIPVFHKKTELLQTHRIHIHSSLYIPDNPLGLNNGHKEIIHVKNILHKNAVHAELA